MNNQLKALFAALADNEVVFFDTNLKSFVTTMANKLDDVPNYQWFYRAFSKQSRFEHTINGKTYWFQKLV